MENLLSSDALVAHLEGEAVVLHAATKEYFRLNETGQVIWRMLESSADLDSIVADLVATYDVSADDARREAVRLGDELLAAGLITSAP